MTEKVKLWCNVKGETSLFSVKPAVEDTIEDVKKLIHSEAFGDGQFPLAKNLVLYKVRGSLDTRFEYTHFLYSPRFKSSVPRRLSALRVLERSICPRMQSSLTRATKWPRSFLNLSRRKHSKASRSAQSALYVFRLNMIRKRLRNRTSSTKTTCT